MLGVWSHTNIDSLVLINLTEMKVFKKIELEFKLQKFCLGSNLVHDSKFSNDENQSSNSVWISENMMLGYSQEPEVCIVC